MNINPVFYKDWRRIDFRSFPSQLSHKARKNNGKNNGNRTGSIILSKKEVKDRERHHVWDKRFRNERNVFNKNEIKEVDPGEHDIWNKFVANSHPEVAFRHIIGICTGKIKPTDEESKDLENLAGFNWEEHPDAAIVAIFEKFMPDELGKMIVPYLNRI